MTSDFNLYISTAIDRAGLPVDPTMDWAKWLDRTFRTACRSITNDPDIVDEAVHAMLVNELYNKRILENNFDPSRLADDKPLDRKVSAYLTKIFNYQIGEVREAILQTYGSGIRGKKGQIRTLPILDSDLSSSQEDYADQDEVVCFWGDYLEWARAARKPQTAQVRALAAKMAMAGSTRTEIAQVMRSSGYAGNRYATYYLLKTWADDVRTFASRRGWGNTSLGRSIDRCGKRRAG